MSKDPFEIGKIDSKKSIGGGSSPTANLGQQAALGRLNETGSAGATAESKAAPPVSAPSDQVQLSKESSESDDARSASVSSNILAAWGAPPVNPVTETSKTETVNKAGEAGAASNSIQGFQVSQAPPPGMQSGGVIGPAGVSGVSPGMSAGGVFSPYKPQAA